MRPPLKLFPYIVAASLLTSAFAAAQSPERDLSGSVRDLHNHPLRGANVQLENEATEQVESFLTDADGHYNFKRVSGDMDYRLWATYRGHRSRPREISKFSSKTVPVITIRIALR